MLTKKRILVFLAVILVMVGVQRLLSGCECVYIYTSEQCASESCNINCEGHGGCGMWVTADCYGSSIKWLINCNDQSYWYQWCECIPY